MLEAAELRKQTLEATVGTFGWPVWPCFVAGPCRSDFAHRSTEDFAFDVLTEPFARACEMSDEKGHGYAGGWSESGFDSSIPVWDGRADTLREFRRTVTWWLSSIDLSKTKGFNLAARFAMKQRGSARLRALEFTPDDLAYTPEVDDPDNPDGEKLVLREADYTAGVWKLIDAWEVMVGKTLNDKKGELRERFYTQRVLPGGFG